MTRDINPVFMIFKIKMLKNKLFYILNTKIKETFEISSQSNREFKTKYKIIQKYQTVV